MRPDLWLLGCLALLTASCEQPSHPKKLADGCYYVKGKPVFKIAGAEGRVIIPSEVTTFKVERGGDNYVTFVPGLLFDANEKAPLVVDAFPGAPPYSMKSGTGVPTIEMHWAAYGDEDVYLGKPC